MQDSCDSELQSIIVSRGSSSSRCNRFCTSYINWLLFLFLLIGQLIGIILFTIWAVDCFFREFRTTAFCDNFNLYSAPQTFESLWLSFSCACSLFLMYHIVYRTPAFCGIQTVVTHLSKRKYFYKTGLVLLAVVVYDVYVLSNSPQTWKTASYILFILDKSFTVALMFHLNFLPRFWTGGQSQFKYWLYKASLATYVLQNSIVALLGSTIAAYKVLTVQSNVDTQNPGAKSVVGLMLLITNNGFRYFVADFFLSKIFQDELDILGGKTIEESIGAQNENDRQGRHRMTPTPPPTDL